MEKERIHLQRIKAHLADMLPRLIDELSEIISGNYWLDEGTDLANVYVLIFEVFVDNYEIGFYPYDEGFGQLGYKDILGEPGNGTLAENDLMIESSNYNLDSEEDEQKFHFFHDELEKMFFRWFVEAWNKAGGKNAQHPAYLQVHDSSTGFDLKAEQWVEME